MKLLIYFNVESKEGQDNDIVLPFDTQKELNSFVYRTLGDNNEYHDKFSDYSISSIQGGKLQSNLDGTKQLVFHKSKPYIQVASENMDFISDLIKGLNERKYTLFNLKFERLEMMEFPVNKRFDTVYTISPVIVKDENGRKISVDNDRFLELLEENCVKKLDRQGIRDTTFKLYWRHKEKAKQRKVMVGDVFNICSMVSLYVYGKPKTRKALYSMGLGGSTGSGFGAITVYA